MSFSSDHREYLSKKKLANPTLTSCLTLCINISKTEEILQDSECEAELSISNKNESELRYIDDFHF